MSSTCYRDCWHVIWSRLVDKKSSNSLFYLEFYTEYPFNIPPSCWFSRLTIDQYPPLLYNYALGFFQTQCGRSTSQSRLPEFELDLIYYSSGIFINILKRIFYISLFKFIRYFMPYFKVVKISFTHLYTTSYHINLIRRSISMCQAFG